MGEEHICNKEDEITAIHDICQRLDAGLRGNGKAGLFTEFAVLKNTVAGLIALDLIIVVGLVSLWIKG